MSNLSSISKTIRDVRAAFFTTLYAKPGYGSSDIIHFLIDDINKFSPEEQENLKKLIALQSEKSVSLIKYLEQVDTLSRQLSKIDDEIKNIVGDAPKALQDSMENVPEDVSEATLVDNENVNDTVVVEEPKVEAVAPVVAAEPKVEAVAPAVAEEPKVEAVAPVAAEEPKVEAVAPAVAEEPKVAEVAPVVAAEEPKIEEVAPVVAAEPKVEAVAPVVAAEPKAEAVAPVVAAEPKVEAVAPVVAEEPKIEAVAPVVAAEPKVEAVAPVVAEEPKAEAVAPVAAEEPKPFALSPINEGVTPIKEAPVEQTATAPAVEFVKFNKKDTNPTKAILVTPVQFDKLNSSKAEQIKKLGNMVSLLVKADEQTLMNNGLLAPTEDATKKQMESIIEQANALYKEGKTAEAQTLFNQVSSMNQQIQAKTNSEGESAKVLVNTASPVLPMVA